MRTHDGRYTGWVPRVVRVPILARRLKLLLLSHAVIFGGRFRPRLARWFSGFYVRENHGFFGPTLGWGPVPFGWLRRHVVDRDAWVVAPCWYFLPELLAQLRDTVLAFAKYRLGALDGPNGGDWSDHRWWPQCPRFE